MHLLTRVQQLQLSHVQLTNLSAKFQHKYDNKMPPKVDNKLISIKNYYGLLWLKLY